MNYKKIIIVIGGTIVLMDFVTSLHEMIASFIH